METEDIIEYLIKNHQYEEDNGYDRELVRVIERLIGEYVIQYRFYVNGVYDDFMITTFYMTAGDDDNEGIMLDMDIRYKSTLSTSQIDAIVEENEKLSKKLAIGYGLYYATKQVKKWTQ